jgi:hypothetical protein
VNIGKDQSIVTQVAAKIASELTPKTAEVTENLTNWLTAFAVVTEALMDAHVLPQATVTEAVDMLTTAFPQAQVSTITSPPQFATSTVTVKGKQHGPLPEWLAQACAQKNIREVWDNRDGLAVNPKRPWFKSTTSDDAFWAPR